MWKEDLLKKVMGMEAVLKRVEKEIRKMEDPVIVGHYDADGISGAAIIAKTLEKIEKNYSVVIVKGLDEKTLKNLGSLWDEFIFVDLGSGYVSLIQKSLKGKIVIVDHHIPESDALLQLNPRLIGMEGKSGSSSSLAYLVSRRLLGKNEMSKVAVVGAVGDREDENGLLGINRICLKDGEEMGEIEVVRDLRIYGKMSRPIHRFLAFSYDPYIPEISGNEKNALKILKELGIEVKERGKFRTYFDLNKFEKKKLISWILHYLKEKKVPKEILERVIGEVYFFPREEVPELFEAREFATLLNACGRMNKGEVGVRIAMGERGRALREGKKLQRKYRKEIMKGLKLLEKIEDWGNFYLIDGRGKVRASIIGIVASIALTAGFTDKPVVGVARDVDSLKISIRQEGGKAKAGDAMKEAARYVGGDGGGHENAGGAFIPLNSLDEFLEKLKHLLNPQAFVA